MACDAVFRLCEHKSSRVLAKIDVDYELAQRLQAEKQKELTVGEKEKLFMQFSKKKRKFFAAKRSEEKRNIPLTRAQQRSIMYFSFGRHLDELHVTWSHLEKKRMRLRTNTKTLEDLCSQSLKTASQAIHDAVTPHQVTASARTNSNAVLKDSFYDGVMIKM
nr:hypothetical protein [Tanacetum cinerariifolium]